MRLVGAVGIELLVDLTKSHAFTVLPTANQMNWSQMELRAKLARFGGPDLWFRRPSQNLYVVGSLGT